MKTLIQILAIAAVGLFVSTAIVFAQPPVIGKVEDHTRTIVCQEFQLLEQILVAQRETSARAGVVIYQMHNSTMDKRGKPMCTLISTPYVVSMAIIGLAATIDDVHWFDGERHTFYIVAVLYERDDGEWVEGYIFSAEAPVEESELQPTGIAL